MIFEIAEYVGTIAFAMSGFFVAARARLDLLGTLVAVFLSAFGGGIIRDVIADRTPYAFSHTAPGILVITVMAVMILLRLHRKESIENKAMFIISDSIGLVSFSIGGSLIALEAGFNLTGVMALAFITAVGGGIARDIIINEVPFVFKTGFYGTVALMIGIIMFIQSHFELHQGVVLGVVFIVGVVLRVVAYYRKWQVPLF